MKLKKITEASDTHHRRHYDDACATAHALDLVGERWALLVLRELMLGPKRFSDLRSSLPGISANVLTQRLESLEKTGVLTRHKLPPPAGAYVYELTDWGYESEPIFQALGRWAARSPAHDPSLPFSAVSLMLSLRTMFNAKRAEGVGIKIGFRLGEETFLGCIANGQIAVTREPLTDTDAIFSGSAPSIARAIYGGQPLATLEAEGVLQIEGDRTVAEQFTSLFPLPPKAQQPS
jgi:DNA-binding HxlR family transcriptional regulator